LGRARAGEGARAGQRDLGGDIWTGDIRPQEGSRELGADTIVERHRGACDFMGFRTCVRLRTERPDLVWDRRQRLGTLNRRREDLEELGVWTAGPGMAVRRAKRDRDARR